jgi:hypothetical protein
LTIANEDNPVAQDKGDFVSFEDITEDPKTSLNMNRVYVNERYNASSGAKDEKHAIFTVSGARNTERSGRIASGVAAGMEDDAIPNYNKSFDEKA